MIILYTIILISSIILTPVVAGVYCWYVINDKKIEVTKNKKVQPRDEAELISILYSVMEREWTYRVKFHFKLKEIKVPKFEYELNYLVERIMFSLSDGFLDELRYYYTDDAIIQLVSSLCQVLILDYMDANKPVSK